MSGNITEAFAFGEAGELGFANGIGALHLEPFETDYFVTDCRCHCLYLAQQSLEEYQCQRAGETAQPLTAEESQTLLQVFQAIIHNVHRNHDFQIWRPYKVEVGLAELMDENHVRICIDLRTQQATNAISGRSPHPVLRATCQDFLARLLQDLQRKSVSDQPKSLSWSYLHWNSRNRMARFDGDVQLSYGEFDMASLISAGGLLAVLKLAWNQ